MGKSVADFKGTDGIFGGQFRDRVRLRITDSNTTFSESYNTKSVIGKFSSGSLERCVDHNHPRFHSLTRSRSRKGASTALRDHDMGGPLAIERSSLTMPSKIRAVVPATIYVPRTVYDGVMFPSADYYNAMANMARGVAPAISSNLGMSKADLEALGSTAIAKSLPDVPNFSLFRFVGELREGLPKVPLKALAKEKKLRNLGGEYLNVQFGVMPLISDLQNFLQAVQNPKLRAHVKHALGEEHRVRKVLDKGKTYTTRPLTGAEMSVEPASMTSKTGIIEISSSFRIWSSCSFAYHQITELDRLLNDLDRITGGLGVAPTAIDIWNLVPWSWLVDWFVNFNQVATNLSYLGRDGLYLQRGYIMAHYEDKIVTSRQGVLYGNPYSTTATQLTERKYRIGASPFGFGLHMADFNPFQVSILGSLGVSRLKF